MCVATCGGGSNPQPTQPTTMVPPPSVSVSPISRDPFTNPGSQHATEVEVSAFSTGTTIVSAFQAGRIFGGGASDIGFATTSDNGAIWATGFLPGLTIYEHGIFGAASDPVVA